MKSGWGFCTGSFPVDLQQSHYGRVVISAINKFILLQNAFNLKSALFVGFDCSLIAAPGIKLYTP
jgi:hypothetical protein